MILAEKITFDTNSSVSFSTVDYVLNSKQTKGTLAWEYKPFCNLRLTEDIISEDGFTVENYAGEITDLITDKLNFSLASPVEMVPQPSYDGSVNLIMTDNRNVPRLINSRFTVRENNTYERVDRLGENDTNLYDVDKFELQTALQKLYNLIPKVTYDGESMTGNLFVGDYVFYFTYCDADENETDIVAESGIVPVFKGQNKTPYNIEGGFRNENSYKAILFTIRNIDPEYSYIKVYYVRYNADVNTHRVALAYKIYKKYQVKDNKCIIAINGLEQTELISEDEINTQYANINKAKTLETLLNRLFLGNVTLNTPEYKELLDLSLRIYPTYEKAERSKLIGSIDHRYLDYTDIENNYEYYNSSNIYNYVGYAPNEIYRVGIVYILKDNSLSPVFNIRGKRGIPEYSACSIGTELDSSYYKVPLYLNESDDDSEHPRKYIDCINETTYEFIDRNKNENSKGVIYIEDNDSLDIYSLRFVINPDTLKEIKKYAKGYFFVRQKRIPLKLGLALTLALELNCGIPTIPYEGKDLVESFMNVNRLITNDYKERLLTVSPGVNANQAALIFPEFEINLPYYNNILTGGKFYVEEAYCNNTELREGVYTLLRDSLNARHYIIGSYKPDANTLEYYDANLIQVADNVKTVGIDDYKFCARAGEAEEGFRYGKVANVSYERSKKYATIFGKTILVGLGDENATLAEDTNAFNYVRGSFGPYVGMVSTRRISPGRIVNVYIPGYSKGSFDNYFQIRYGDSTEYNAISDRYNLTDEITFANNVYRGDSYVCNFTHRLNRNFNDPAAPMNDEIVDKNTWAESFEVSDGVVKKDKFDEINLGDLNAVLIGSWITIKVRCSKNLSLRSLDTSNADETALYGHPRSFYPMAPMSVDGSYKIPESEVYNDAFSSSLGSKEYVLLPDVPYFKNSFQTRIYYSDIYINDAFINGYRRIVGNQYRDYETHYGGLVKILSYGRDLICVFEHAITKLSINLQTPISLNEEEPVFINSHNVLPESMVVLSDSIGSLWKDSVIKTDTYIYGVDTNAKKIWRYGSNGLGSISDFKVLLFLNQNITLTETELTPYLGVRNIKAHYNKNKGDVMFTYYDDLSSYEEAVWNLCWNEKQEKWITFYSWVPEFSTNIYNSYFSFDRNSSKYVSKLGMSSELSNDATGIVVKGEPFFDKGDLELDLKRVSIPDINGLEVSISYSKVKDIYGFNEYYEIEDNTIRYIDVDRILEIMDKYELPVALFNIKASVTLSHKADTYASLISSYNGYLEYNSSVFENVVALTTETIYNYTKEALLENPNLSSWFWAHGKTGIYDIEDTIKPTKWYGKQHPFELEFIVNDKIDSHKIFDDLEIISNKAEPESFHYEIVGDSFDFAEDKENMYIRLEATKELYQYNNFDVTYDTDYVNCSEYHRPLYDGATSFDKSTLFPLYYSRQDKINTIEDYYHLKDDVSTKDFSMLAGAEIKKNVRDKEFHIWNHAKAVDIKSKDRIRGNMQYKEDKWYIQINPINLVQKNEPAWVNDKVPIELGLSPIPNEILLNKTLKVPTKPESSSLYNRGIVSWNYNDSSNQEVKLKDKWMKVRIRYSGKKLVVIHSIQTLYNITTS